MNNESLNTIPYITNPLGQHWQQPAQDSVLVDDDYALMSESDFSQLLEYSTSIPTGVYEGKMWKRRCSDGWMLGWYGFEVDDGKAVTTNFREVLLV